MPFLAQAGRRVRDADHGREMEDVIRSGHGAPDEFAVEDRAFEELVLEVGEIA